MVCAFFFSPSSCESYWTDCLRDIEFLMHSLRLSVCLQHPVRHYILHLKPRRPPLRSVESCNHICKFLRAFHILEHVFLHHFQIERNHCSDEFGWFFLPLILWYVRV